MISNLGIYIKTEGAYEAYELGNLLCLLVKSRTDDSGLDYEVTE